MSDRGCIRIIFPGVVESYAPLETVEHIDMAMSVLSLCREIAKRRESDIPAQIRIFDEDELMVLGGAR